MNVYVNYPESEELLTFFRNIDFSYPIHMHNCMEFTFVTGGEVHVNIGGKVSVLGKGQGVFVPPHYIHSYQTPSNSVFYTFLVGRNVLLDFSNLFDQKSPEILSFTFPEDLQHQLDEHFLSSQSVFASKALLYRACHLLLNGNRWVDKDNRNGSFIQRLMQYLQENFREDITLETFANSTGYSYHYICKQIHRQFGVTFTQLLAQHRVAHACNLLDTKEKTITETAIESGFGSIRSFNRIFSQQTGMTPTQYLHRIPD